MQRSRFMTEAAITCSVSAIFMTWGWVVYISLPQGRLPAALSIVAVGPVIALACLLSPVATALLVGGGNAAVLLGGFLRVPALDTAFFLPVIGMSIGIPFTVFAALSRDRMEFQEFIARRALGTANEELLRQENLRSQLFTNLSHDLRTPLSIIKNDVGRLPSVVAPASAVSVAGSFERIDRNVDTTVDLLDQILELARLDDGGTPRGRGRSTINR